MISFSQEYAEQVTSWLEEFADDPESWHLPQFIAKKGIGQTNLRLLIAKHSEIRQAYEVALAKMCVRWQEKALSSAQAFTPQVMEMFKKYLHSYDRMSALEKIDDAQLLKEHEIQTMANFAPDNYADARLDAPYQAKYDDNDRKRRNGKEAQ